MSPAQCRAARALLGWTRERLAATAGKGYRCVNNFECESREIRPETLAAITAALESAGVVFVDGGVTIAKEKGNGPGA